MGLLEEEGKTGGKVRYSPSQKSLAEIQKPHIVETEPFSNTFGPKAQRKRPRLDIGSLEELGESTSIAKEDEAAGELNSGSTVMAHVVQKKRLSTLLTLTTPPLLLPESPSTPRALLDAFGESYTRCSTRVMW